VQFRPCIDIHNGKVKQIVGGSLRDAGDQAAENFVSHRDAAFYAKLYQKDGLTGGHVILLNSADSAYYPNTKAQALATLRAYPGGLMVGGGINPENAGEFLEAGASHVIVTSYVFKDGRVDYGNLERLAAVVGRKHLVLDVSCRKRDGRYYVVTDRWQRFTDEVVEEELLDRLSAYADEFLIHAVDVEGKAAGIERELVKLLGSWGKIPVTYAGGVGSFADLEELRTLGQGRLDVTIGSALDLFGGSMEYTKVLEACRLCISNEQCQIKELQNAVLGRALRSNLHTI
jgi:phosphoribosylformimino-5-aminoimidazole carboxamide ribotide isomerase